LATEPGERDDSEAVSHISAWREHHRKKRSHEQEHAGGDRYRHRHTS